MKRFLVLAILLAVCHNAHSQYRAGEDRFTSADTILNFWADAGYIGVITESFRAYILDKHCNLIGELKPKGFDPHWFSLVDAAPTVAVFRTIPDAGGAWDSLFGGSTDLSRLELIDGKSGDCLFAHEFPGIVMRVALSRELALVACQRAMGQRAIIDVLDLSSGRVLLSTEVNWSHDLAFGDSSLWLLEHQQVVGFRLHADRTISRQDSLSLPGYVASRCVFPRAVPGGKEILVVSPDADTTLGAIRFVRDSAAWEFMDKVIPKGYSPTRPEQRWLHFFDPFRNEVGVYFGGLDSLYLVPLGGGEICRTSLNHDPSIEKGPLYPVDTGRYVLVWKSLGTGQKELRVEDIVCE